MKAVEAVQLSQKATELSLAGISDRMASLEKRLGELQETAAAIANDHSALTLANDEVRRLSELHWEERVITLH